MPNKRSAEKALRQTKWRTEKTKRVKKHINSLAHQITRLIKDEKHGNAKELVMRLQQTLAKAAKTHIIHTNEARRKTAQIYRLTNSVK